VGFYVKIYGTQCAKIVLKV